MRSIHHYHHHTPPLSTLSNWSTRHAQPPAGVLQRHFPNHVRTKPMAVSSSSHLVVLAVSSPAAAGDISVLIPTSVAFIFLYWIANFVVPGMIMKDLQADDANKDQNANDQNLN